MKKEIALEIDIDDKTELIKVTIYDNTLNVLVTKSNDSNEIKEPEIIISGKGPKCKLCGVHSSDFKLNDTCHHDILIPKEKIICKNCGGIKADIKDKRCISGNIEFDSHNFAVEYS